MAKHFAVFGSHQNGRFAAQAEMGKLRHRCGEHGGDSGVDGVAAAVIHAHAGFRGILRASATAPCVPREGTRIGALALLCGYGQKQRCQ